MNHIDRAYEIQFRAYNEDKMYTDKEAAAIAKLGKDMIEDGSYSIIYEDVAHACYTKLVIDTNPEIKAYVLAPLAVLPEFQRKGYATRLMDKAENELDADVIFVMGHPKHYSRRYNTAHKVETPLPSDKSEHWFAKELVRCMYSFRCGFFI